MSTAACALLTRIAAYQIPNAAPSQHPFHLIISRGSVVDFSHHNPQSAAIVNAANEGCLGGGGVDGAIGNAGGPKLFEDRRALPMVGPGVRCKTGSAVVTGPNSYGKLHNSYVIHAVGPNYRQFNKLADGDALLSSAYVSSLNCAKDANLEAVAFSLLSSGIFRGKRSQKEVLRTGMDAIANFDGYAELQEVHMCAFTEEEAKTLVEIADEMGLKSGHTNEPGSTCDLL
eukprot:CAMPEP_0172528708 /NCGR_PEP_ID=MMETSP1067-20121228/3012_1 /TAXON_ID=265564 ORGANISM="Thalassiosira punctigera, Strain Tpunct2005C2" /NCGR_SAMPLE_ID=MMETSP1067 /ASSEMBLY_ACC=CAM_ASM_000444 /LENGTH=228 /DNA_ID=CAMNT_0013312665 /DNA_START=33 /DNA_END=719 /DNA_ORIENTATION=+